MQWNLSDWLHLDRLSRSDIWDVLLKGVTQERVTWVICMSFAEERKEAFGWERESKLSKPHHIYRINVLYKTLLFTIYLCRICTSEKFEFNDKLLTFHHSGTTPPIG